MIFPESSHFLLLTLNFTINFTLNFTQSHVERETATSTHTTVSQHFSKTVSLGPPTVQVKGHCMSVVERDTVYILVGRRLATKVLNL